MDRYRRVGRRSAVVIFLFTMFESKIVAHMNAELEHLDMHHEQQLKFLLKVSSLYYTKTFSMIFLISSAYLSYFCAATPVPPIITMVKNFSKSVAVSWKSGYNGGTPQTLEIWYRLTNTDDYHWQIMKNIPDHVTSYEIDDIDNQNSYIFSMRGLNNLGSGVFSPIFCSKNRLFEGYGKDSGNFDILQDVLIMKLCSKYYHHLRVNLANLEKLPRLSHLQQQALKFKLLTIISFLLIV